MPHDEEVEVADSGSDIPSEAGEFEDDPVPRDTGN